MFRMRPTAITLNYSVENIWNDVRQKIIIIIIIIIIIYEKSHSWYVFSGNLWLLKVLFDAMFVFEQCY